MCVLDKIKKAVALKAEADSLLKEISYNEVAEALVKSVFENENVKKYVKAVYVTGYVPSFNDGDPCTFSSYATFRWVGEYYEEDEDIEIEDLEGVGWSSYEDEQYFNKYCNYLNINFDTWKEIKKHIGDAMIDDDYILENIFDSNFRLTLKNDGTYSLDEYWCGY